MFSLIQKVELFDAEKDSCEKQKNVSHVYNGSCDPCATQTCGKDYTCHVDLVTRQPVCRCKSTCLDVVEPVCASNGKTYRNRCTMDQVSVNNSNRSFYNCHGLCKKLLVKSFHYY